MRFLVLVMALAVGGCASVIPDPVVPSPVSSSSPLAARVVPDSALLVVGDFPGKGWRVVERSQGAVGIPEWAGWLTHCPGHRATTFATRDQRVDVLSRLYAVWPEARREVLQTVELYQVGERALADLRVLVDLCADYEFAGRDDPPFRERASVLASDGLFVRLLRESSSGETTRYVAVSRRGDLLVTVEMTGLTEPVARTVASVAATRLGPG